MNHHPEGNRLVALDEIGDVLRSREGPPQAQPVPPRRRRWVSVAVVVVGASLAIGVAVVLSAREDDHRTRTSSGGASCASAVVWNGETYFGTRLNRPATLARSLGRGNVPNCSDGGDNTPTSDVALVALEGVPPAEAVAIADDPSTAYIKPGYFTQRPHTALHDLLYGTDPNVPDERGAECRQATTATVRANVRGASFGILHVKLLDSTEFPPNNVIFPDARTVITGGGANPHVAPGDLIGAEVLVCRKKNDPQFLKLVATRVSLPAATG